MPPFEDLKNQLTLTEENRLMLGPVAMILMPAWFFGGIMQRVVAEAGREIAVKVYYDAGYDGAYQWGRVQVEAGLTGREIMEHYLGSMTQRGWGRFEIVDLDTAVGRGLFRLYNSAVAQERNSGAEAVCIWVPGAMAGAMQVILDHGGDHGAQAVKVRGREIGCLAQGKPYCEFEVVPQ